MIFDAAGSGASRGPAGPVITMSLLVLLASLAVGLGAGMIGWWLLLVLVGLLVAGAVLYRPFFGVLLLAATIPAENMLMVGELGLGRAIGLAVFGAWLFGKIANRQSWRRVVSNPLFPVALGFVIWVLASMLWAEHRLVVRSGVIRLAQMIALALIIIDLADSRRKLDLLAKVLVLSSLVAAGLTLYQYEVLGVRRAGADIAGGINATAILLVTMIPVGFYLLRASRNVLWGLVGTLFIGLGSVSVATTFSRLNLLLLPPLFALLYLLSLRERRARGWLLAVTVLGGVGAAFFVPWSELRERTETIDAYLNQTLQFGQEQATTSARGYHLRIGLAIARDHPIVGVGYGNYGYYFRDEYQFQVQGAEKYYKSVRSPHSAYVGIAADLGIIGLGLWVMLLGVCGLAGVRAWRSARGGGANHMLPIIETVLIMLGLNIFAYGLYTPHQNDKLLWVIMAMCVAAAFVVEKEIAESVHRERDISHDLELLPAEPAAGSFRSGSG